MRLFFLFATTALVIACAAQPTDSTRYLFATERYGVENGLPDRRVLSLAQDDRGFLWMATPLGLVRFDGRAFDVLTRTEGLASDAIEAVMRDGDGLLWVAHSNGALDIVDPITRSARSVQQQFNGAVPAALNEPVRAYAVSPKGTIVLGVWGGFVTYRSRTEGFHEVNIALPGFPAPNRGAPPERNDGHCLLEPASVSDAGELWCWCRTDRDFDLVQLQLTGDHAQVLGRYTTATGAPQRGLDLAGGPLVAGTYVVQRTTSGVEVRYVTADGHSSRPVARTGSRSAWSSLVMPLTEQVWMLGTTIGMLRAGDDPAQATVLYDVAGEHPEAAFKVNHALRDRLGHVWLATDFGLFQVTMQRDRFQRLLYDPDMNGSHGVRVRGTVAQHGTVHVNTDQEGYRVVDARTGRELYTDTTRKVRLGMAVDGAGGLWRAEARTVLHENSQGQVDRIVPTAGALIWSLLPLQDGSLLLGSDRGLLKLHAGDSAQRTVHADHPELDRTRILHLLGGKNGRVMASTESGLYELTSDGSVLERWWSGGEGTHAFPTDDIRHVHIDSAGIHWIATGTRGLLRWDRNANTLRAIDVRDGLPSASVHAVYPDRAGWLWLPTNLGLVRYRPSTGQVKVFSTAHGITANEFNRLAHTQGDDGRLYFGGLNGITVLDPADFELLSSEAIAPLVLKRALVQHGNEQLPQEITSDALRGSAITLLPNDRYVLMDVALLSFDPPSLTRYAYRIDGIDNDWNVQREPSLRLTTLPYGEHVLRLRAMDAEGRWTPRELQFTVRVPRPVYLRWWSIAACALLVAGAGYAFFRYRLQRLREVIRVRDRIARDLHDEVGSKLSSNVLFTTAVRNSTSLSEQADAMLQRIADNSKTAMEGMNDIVWSVNSANDSLDDVLHRMRAFAQPLCESAGVSLAFEVKDALLVQRLDMEERKSLYLVFKEAVANAVRHARCAHIRVSLVHEERALRLRVEDDGAGFVTNVLPHDTLGGNGLGNMRRRAEEVGGTCAVESAPGRGTCVELRFVPKG